MSGRECTWHAAEPIDSALAHMQKQCAGPTVPANCRRSGEIRFEQATKLELVIDKKAAKALGITVSQALGAEVQRHIHSRRCAETLSHKAAIGGDETGVR